MVDYLLKAAQYYHNEGLCVIPITPRDKRPALATWEEYQTRRSTGQELVEWFGNGKEYNIGIVHGEVSNNFVSIDIDHDVDVFVSLLEEFPQLASGRIEQSGSYEGYHIPLFIQRLPNFGNDRRQGRPKGNKTWKTRGGIVNIRARYCQTVVPPSIHPSGRRYRFVQKGAIPTLPDLNGVIAWLNKVDPPPTPTPTAIIPRPISPGRGNLIDSILERVDLLQVFDYFGKSGKTQEERGKDDTREVRILGNGGLLVNRDKGTWYNFRDEEGGGVIEAWAWCRYGSADAKKQHFRKILLELALYAGVDVSQYYRPGDEHHLAGAVAAPIATRWDKEYQGYWA